MTVSEAAVAVHEPTRVRSHAPARTWIGRSNVVAGLAAWSGWLGWRLAGIGAEPVTLAVLAVELLAFVSTLVVAVACWSLPSRQRLAEPSDGPLPVRLRGVLGLEVDDEPARCGADDTGEIAWARRAGRQVAAHLRPGRRRAGGRSTLELAWAVVALDGARRMLSVVVLVVVLFSGVSPFPTPAPPVAAALIAGVGAVALGTWVLSGGVIRPGDRLVWSMASVGAGVGQGVSRTGLPIRWATTMGSMIVLNLAVALRGLSDRWTHGLGAMPHEARVLAMSAAFALVAAGFAALHTMPAPELAPFGAGRRLEETSARRLALGATLAVALLGFVVGVVPVNGGV